MGKPEILTLAAASGSDQDLGIISTIPVGGVLYVRAPAEDFNILDWLVSANKSYSVQKFVSDVIADSWGIANAGMNNADTVVVNGKTFTAHTDTTVYADQQFAMNGTPTAEAALLARMLNPGYVFTCASVAVGDPLTIDGITFTAAAAAALDATRKFAQITSDAATATSLAASINDSVYGVPGVIAVANGAEVHVMHRSEAIWKQRPIVAVSGAATITATATGVPGIVATSAAAALTIKPKRSEGAYTLQVVGNARAVATCNTPLSLYEPSAKVAYDAVTATGGDLIEQWTKKWPYPYLGITNDDGADALTVTVKVGRHGRGG